MITTRFCVCLKESSSLFLQVPYQPQQVGPEWASQSALSPTSWATRKSSPASQVPLVAECLKRHTRLKRRGFFPLGELLIGRPLS